MHRILILFFLLSLPACVTPDSERVYNEPGANAVWREGDADFRDFSQTD